MPKILEDAMGRQHIIINPTKPPSHIIAARIDEFKKHQVLWSGGSPEEHEIPYAYQTNGGTEIFLYQIKNLVNPPKVTNANTAYWWSYCCTEDFVFSIDTSDYLHWYIVKADKNGNMLATSASINCNHLTGICSDGTYLYASSSIISGMTLSAYLLRMNFDLDILNNVSIGEYQLVPMVPDNDYLYGINYIAGTGSVLQKRNKTTLSLVSQVVATFAGYGMCLDDNYIYYNDWDNGCIRVHAKSDLSYIDSFGSGFIDPYGLWMNKEFIVSYDYGDWDGAAYFRRYRLSDRQLMQTLKPEHKLDTVANSQWKGGDFFVNYE